LLFSKHRKRWVIGSVLGVIGAWTLLEVRLPEPTILVDVMQGMEHILQE
jgi:hypothetical protein